jgi:hypothetical protein
MTDQEIFDKVATHLLTQNKKAADAQNMCVMLTDDGSMCAVGCLLKQPKNWNNLASLNDFCIRHQMTIEDGVDALTSSEERDFFCELSAAIGPINQKTFDLLIALQLVHDTFDVENWAERLKNVAVRNKLDTTVLDALEMEV